MKKGSIDIFPFSFILVYCIALISVMADSRSIIKFVLNPIPI